MRRGIMYMMLATLMFTLMVASVKVARQELPALEIVFFRSVVSLPLAWLAALRGGVQVHRRGLLALRVVVGFGAMFGFFTASRTMALADLAIVSRLQPILVALLAPLLLGAGERNTGWVWVSVALGFGGTAVLVGPELAMGTFAVLFALMGAGCSAVAHVLVRLLSASERPESLVFWFQVGLFGLAGSLLVLQHGTIPLPGSHLWPVLLGCGLFATIGQLLMTRAYSTAPAGRIAAASYLAPLWGALGDVLLFAHMPGASALLGGGLVIGAGVLLLSLRDPAQPHASAEEPGAPA